MKALVTGDRGFIGRHFVEYLKSLEWEVYGIDIIEGHDVIDYFKYNVDEQFDLVIHCAYVVGGRAVIDGHRRVTKNGFQTDPLFQNLILDSMMFDWARRTNQGAVIYFSSSAAYPADWQQKGLHYKLNEDKIDLDKGKFGVIPDSNYGWAKLTGERCAKAFSDLGGRVHIVRPFSGYGSGQSLDYPFPSIMKRATEGDLTVWGPPGQTRDWIHVDDVIRGAYQVYYQDVREPINLCTGVGTEMGDLALKAYYALSGPKDIVTKHNVEYLEDKPTGVFHRVGDPTKFHQIYTPKITIQEGVERWLREKTPKTE